MDIRKIMALLVLACVFVPLVSATGNIEEIEHKEHHVTTKLEKIEPARTDTYLIGYIYASAKCGNFGKDVVYDGIHLDLYTIVARNLNCNFSEASMVIATPTSLVIESYDAPYIFARLFAGQIYSTINPNGQDDVVLIGYAYLFWVNE